VLVGRAVPHHPRLRGVRHVGGRRVARRGRAHVEDHHVRGCHHPVVALGWRHRKGVGVARVGPTLQHVGKAHLARRRLLLLDERQHPFPAVRVLALRVVGRGPRQVRVADPAVGALPQRRHVALRVDLDHGRLAAHRGGRRGGGVRHLLVGRLGRREIGAGPRRGGGGGEAAEDKGRERAHGLDLPAASPSARWRAAPGPNGPWPPPARTHRLPPRARLAWSASMDRAGPGGPETWAEDGRNFAEGA
jgi:hypothetical protein